MFILLFINVAFCADLFIRCALKDLTHARCTFSVLISLSAVSGLLYCALNTFLSRPLQGPSVTLYVYISLLLTLALWAQYRMTHGQEKVKIFIKKIDDFLPKSGRLCVGKKVRKVFANELKKGDQVLVNPGERIPCNGVIVKGQTAIDEQLISGNIRYTAKQEGNSVYAGTLNKLHPIYVQVESALSSSVVMDILNAIKSSELRRNGVLDSLEKSAVWLTVLLVVFAAGTYGYALAGHGTADWLHQTGILWLILTLGCPVSWLFTAVFPSFFIVRGARRQGIDLNSLETVQTFVQADTIFLDKTGTLTLGQLEISGVFAQKNSSQKEVLQTLATAEQQVDDVFAQAVLDYARQEQITLQPVKSVEVVPGQGVCAQTKKEVICVGRASWLQEQGIKVPAPKAGSEAVICVAQNNHYLGYVTLKDSLREGAAEAIEYLKKKNKEIILISGDTESSVQGVARQVGIEKVNFNVLPKTKAEIITNLRALGKRVVMVGDGFNDIVALLKADGGIVFGSAKNVYNHWVDILIKRSDLYTLTDLFTIDRRLHATIWWNMALAVGLQSCFVVILLWKESVWKASWQVVLGVALLGILFVLINSMRLLKIK